MKKKILVISPYNPFTPILSAAARTLHYRIRNLAAMAEVTLLTFTGSGGQEKKTASKFGVTGHFILHPRRHDEDRPSGLTRILRVLTGRLQAFDNINALVSALALALPDILRDRRFDLIHIDDVIIAPIVRHLPEGTRRLLFFHNLMTLQYRSYVRAKRGIHKKLAACIEHLWIHRFEAGVMKNFPTIVVLTDVERRKAAAMSPATRVVQIPLEVDLEEYQPSPEPVDFRRITLSGTMSYEPNHEGALHFIREILPGIRSRFDDVKFFVVGKSPREDLLRFHNGQVVVTGEVENIQDYLKKSGVVVAPILSGGGMRMKILEAFALSKAVVSTSLGAEGIEYTDDENILIADAPDAFARRVCSLLENPGECARLGRNARRLMEERYAVPLVWAKWREVYRQLGIS
jgi:glycosyltransferase involved in cell wall biosynthesis